MAVQPQPRAERSGPSPPPSERVRLARAALEACLALDGVAEGHPGRTRMRFTMSGTERMVGVVAAPGPDGRFDLGLHLVAHPVPLHPLAGDIRRSVSAAAAAEGLRDLLGTVDVTFEDLAEPALVSGGLGSPA